MQAAVLEVAAGEGVPVVVRIDVADGAIAVRPREPRPASAVSGCWSTRTTRPTGRARSKRVERAWADAAETAAGGEALLVSADGLVGETTRANVFAVLGDGRW